jgi:dATP pyrophosphohydrolase
VAGTKIPESVLVLIHTDDLQVLLLERADHPGFWQSVTGSRDRYDEPLIETAARELFEETGIRLDMPQVGPLKDWQFHQTYEIFPHWRHRYPDGVTENVEHVFSISVPRDIAIRLADREHTAYRWLPLQEAAEACFSWSNAKSIRELPRHLKKLRSLRLATYNIHKGERRSLPGLRKELRIHDLQSTVSALCADVICLQEVQGRNDRGPLRYQDWPAHGQHQFLAPKGYHVVYAGAAQYLHGHHGNALMSRFPIDYHEIRDFSDHALEKRATLHAVLRVHEEPVHVFVVHFGLFAASRRRQLLALVDWVQQVVPEGAPLLIAGDFNDWRLALGNRLISALDVTDVTRSGRRLPIRTFPSFMPMMHMDRIFQRGFQVQSVGAASTLAPQLNTTRGWSRLSDHMPVIADLLRT